MNEKQTHIDLAFGRRSTEARSFRRAGAVVALVLGLSLLLAGRASAAYEQARNGSEPVQFGQPEEFRGRYNATESMAVNRAGDGDVAPGSVYVISRANTVVRLSPGEEGEEPQVEEEWGWNIAGDGAYDRCGPAYEGAEDPAEHVYAECNPRGNVERGESPGQFGETPSLAVDQATGNVYVLSASNPQGGGPRQHHMVQVFTAKGKPIGQGFGDAAQGENEGRTPESIAESPAKLHMSSSQGIAVDDSGKVYLIDMDFFGVEHGGSRVMSFEPCAPQDYEHYCYAAGEDLPLLGSREWNHFALVGRDRVVVATPELIQEYPLGASNRAPVCSQPVTGQLYGMTANELTGEVFWFRFSDHKLRRLAPCDESTGRWAELDAIIPKPTISFADALTVNPTKSWGPLRPNGVLYAFDAEVNGQGYVFVPAKAGPRPVVQNTRATQTTASSSVLAAEIDPEGYTTRYRFEYLSDADYAANGGGFAGPAAPAQAPTLPAAVPSGAAANVAAAITGLSPETTYHFRLVATSECEGAGRPLCETVGVGGEFTTFGVGVGALLDSRAYELVSPSRKNGGEVYPANSEVYSCLVECKPPGHVAPTVTYPILSAPDGNAIVYQGQPFSAAGSGLANSYLATRTTSGWLTATMTPALQTTGGGAPLAYSDDLSEAILSQGIAALSPEAPAGYNNLYLQRTAEPESPTPLIKEAPPNRAPGGFFKLEYGGRSADFAAQFFEANDVLTQATQDAPQAPALTPTERDLYEWRDGSLSMVNVLPGNEAVAVGASFASLSPDAHGASADGSRVFWNVGPQLYVREDGRTTRALAHSGEFLTASASGDEVLFADGCLYRLATEACTDLTQGEEGFLGVAGQTESLSKIYFVDTAALAGVNARGEEAVEGMGNLYLYEEGGGTRFIVSLNSQRDKGVWNWRGVNSGGVQRNAEASPDGRYLAFGSRSQLVDYNNVGLCETGGATKRVYSQGPCSEVYLFDSATGQLRCVSCDPTGEAPRGPSVLPSIQAPGPQLAQPRYLTDQGRLFFDSQDRLTPLDVNGRVEDVYELEPFGVGSCQRPAGCLSLVSPGTGEVDSNFFAMSSEGGREGADAFFTTRERLVPADTDGLIDLYDAREGGGFANPVEAATECQGESCQPVAVPPKEATPASSAFHGPGNVHEGKAKKKQHKKHKKKHHKKKHKQAHKKQKHGHKPGSKKKAAKRDHGGTK